MSVPGQKLLGSVLCLPPCPCITAICPQGPTASLLLPEAAQELLGGERDKKQRKLTITAQLGLVGGTPARGREVGIKWHLKPLPTQIMLWFCGDRSPVWQHLQQHSDYPHMGLGMPCPLSYTGPCFSLFHCYHSSQGLLKSCGSAFSLLYLLDLLLPFCGCDGFVYFHWNTLIALYRSWTAQSRALSHNTKSIRSYTQKWVLLWHWNIHIYKRRNKWVLV